ncbi:MAG: hypothetical protein KDB53_13020, partial [Planctomycetes bacterium]|nr:hypothetical protein [Planctomycetota bacterium]
GVGEKLIGRDADEAELWNGARAAYQEERPDGEVGPFEIMKETCSPGVDHRSWLADLDADAAVAITAWLSSITSST